MTRNPDRPRAPRGLLPREEAELEAFFDAARARPVSEPSIDFLSAILADAAEVGTLHVPVTRPAPRPPARRRGFGGFLAGWSAAAALGACAALGFWLGFAGLSDLGLETTRYTANTESASGETAADSLGEFFDMASLTQ